MGRGERVKEMGGGYQQLQGELLKNLEKTATEKGFFIYYEWNEMQRRIRKLSKSDYIDGMMSATCKC